MRILYVFSNKCSLLEKDCNSSYEYINIHKIDGSNASMVH